MDKERFSLLLLEPGEIYFEELSVFLCEETSIKNKNIETEKNQLGRLKICSKSLVFDPKDLSKPLIKIPFKECAEIRKIDDRHLRWLLSSEKNVITISCNQYIEMLEGNILAPYVFKNVKKTFFFLLNYANIEVCLRQISQLYRASTLPVLEQSQMIAAIERGRQAKVQFDPVWFEDLYEKVVMEIVGNKITPLVVNPGRILLTTSTLYFQPFNTIEPHFYLKIPLKEIKSVIQRRFLLRQVGLEVYCREDCEVKYLYLVLNTQTERDKLYNEIMIQPSLELDESNQEKITLLWQNGVLSNYDYLLYLNSLADRTFNDLTQYPVFPWVIADYSSQNLDLDNPETYRDLSKPVGALNPERFSKLKERYEEMPHPRFLYGSHYSTPGFVLFYLVRKFPHYMLCLQNGRFDHPDRMFNSIPDVWRNVLTNMSDFKELVPEFYDDKTNGDFLENRLGINFGYRSDGSRVGNVILPPWAKDVTDFISKMRQALESNYVSANLHHWIDLIFGYKQSGKEAENAHNLFYYLCYEGAVDLDSVSDWSQRHGLEVQIMEFGQIPKQIFTKPHPQRTCIYKIEKPLSCTKIGKEAAKKGWTIKAKNVITSHKEAVTAIAFTEQYSEKCIVSVGHDSLLKIHSVKDLCQQRSVALSNMPLSSVLVLPDGKTVMAGCWDCSIIIYDVEFGKVLDQVLGHEDAVSCLIWGSKKGILVSGSWDCSVSVWRAQFPYTNIKPASSLLARLEHDTKVTAVSIDHNNEHIASGTDDGDIFLWSLDSRSIIQRLPGHSSTVNDIAFNPDGTKLVSCSDDRSFRVYDTTAGIQVFTKTVDEELKCLALNGAVFLLGGSHGTLFLWDLIDVTLIQQEKKHNGAVLAVNILENENSVVTGSDDHKLVIWSLL
ncbi:protein FAN-like [Lycorma delicatula]|uniref:protein FAN-like n=1 Tax=Lycorma delicatula TaxID=130591 RepID=UPI003F512ADD